MKTTWPGNVQDKPVGWEDWSEEARAAFTRLWEGADEKLKLGYLEDIKERQGNQKDLEDYFICLGDCKGSFGNEDEMQVGGIGCSLRGMILLLLLSTIILGVCLW